MGYKVSYIENIKGLEEIARKIDGTVILVKNNIRINKLIEESSLGDNELVDLKIAYEVKFDGVMFNTQTKSNFNVKSMKEVLEKIDTAEDYQLIVDTTDVNLFANILQQFVYLNIHIDIFTKKEYQQKRVYDRYKQQKENLKDTLNNFEKKVLGYKENGCNTIERRKEDIIQKVTENNDYIEQIQERELKIVVMATKKTGKSVIVNSFLKDEYAPTSLQLATPNSVIYKAWNENYIKLQIENDSIIHKFNTTNECKTFLQKKFKEAEENKNGLSMQDVTIHYPRNELNYTIIDIPGPDLAGSTHAKSAYKWLEEADVVIFGIDYSKYLTIAEEQFLKNIKQKLDEQGKFYSLIITANKLDQIYTSEGEKKSIPSTLDFLRNKLDDLDESFKSTVILGTSAKQYFDLMAYEKFLKENNKYDSKIEAINSLLNKTNPKDLNSEMNTRRKFIKDQKGNLEDFYYIENVTKEAYNKHSGMPFLIKKVNYIAENKALMEITNNLMGKLSQNNALLSSILMNNLLRLSKNKEKINYELTDIALMFKIKKEEFNKKIDDLLEVELNKNTQDIFLKRFNEVSEQTKSQISKFLNSKKEEMLNTNKSKSDIDKDALLKTLSNNISNILKATFEGINKEKNDSFDILQDYIIDLNNNIIKNIKNRSLLDKYGLHFELPTLPPALAKSSFSHNFTNLDNDLIIGKLSIEAEKIIHLKQDKTFEEILNSPIESFIEFLTGSFPSKDITKTTVDEVKLSKQLENYEIALKKLITAQLKELAENTSIHLKKSIIDFTKQTKVEGIDIVKSYEEINDTIKNSLNIDKEKLEKQEEFINNIKPSFEEFLTIWDSLTKE